MHFKLSILEFARYLKTQKLKDGCCIKQKRACSKTSQTYWFTVAGIAIQIWM